MARQLSGHGTLSKPEAVRLRVKVVPNSSKSEIVGWLDPRVLKVKVAAIPEDGKANKELAVLLAKTLRVRRQAIQVVSGTTSRLKLIAIDGLSDEDLRARLCPREG